MKTVFEIPIALGYTKIIVDECCSIEHARTIAYQLSRENGNRKVRVTFPVDNIKKDYQTMLPYTFISAEPKTIKPKINKRLAVLVFMFTVLLIVLLFSLNEVNGQCQYSKNIVDEFTKDLIRVLTPQTIVNEKNYSLTFNSYSFNLRNKGFIFNLLHKSLYYKDISYCLNQSSAISFIIKTGEVLRIPYSGKLDCGKNKIIGITPDLYWYTISGNYDLTDKQLEILKKGFTKIRFTFADNQIDFEVPEILEPRWLNYLEGNTKINPQFYFKIYDICL